MEADERYEAKCCGKIGILTFHCADNFGAMLQAYGLLTWLSQNSFDAFIVNYAPPFLRGREWLFPYIPVGSLKERGYISLCLFKRNLKAGKDWWVRKRRMYEFRRRYLTKGRKAFYRIKSLSNLEADLLIVGSDQIWNPNITFGLRPAYFGAFTNRHIRKTIAYAASFGGDTLPKTANSEFSRLLVSVQDISMREKGAAEYVRANFRRKTAYTIDPSFLLSTEEWHAIEDKPEECGYILYYETEYNELLRKAACRLAQKKALKVIELSGERNRRRWPFQLVNTAGPAQFLGYVAAAAYIFTNSFHGLVFSIIFHKPFYIYNHSTVGARIECLLEDTGLINRMEKEGFCPDIEEAIEWEQVEKRLEVHRERSMRFLRDSLTS